MPVSVLRDTQLTVLKIRIWSIRIICLTFVGYKLQPYISLATLKIIMQPIILQINLLPEAVFLIIEFSI